MRNPEDSSKSLAPDGAAPWLSVIVPARNESARIAETLAPLQAWRGRGVEVILVDGDSSDGTPEAAAQRVDHLLRSAPGRAHQMNQGMAQASAPQLWFLHADTRVDERHLRALQDPPRPWGHFRVRLSGRHPLFPVIAALMNVRSRVTGISTGDQSLFGYAVQLRTEGGFPEQPLMEDVALTARLRRRIGPPAQLGPAVVTDSRRWEMRGPWRTMMQMWWLRWRYWRGDDPAALQRQYERENA